MVSCSLDWTGRETKEPRLQLFGAVVGYQLDGKSTVPTADVAFFGANTGPLAALTFRCAVGGAALFLTLETKGECKEQLPNWTAGCWDV